MKRLWRRPLGDRGVTALEFALIAPVVLTMVAIFTEAAMQVATAAALDQAARTASRAGITGSKLDGTSATVAERNEAIRQAVLSSSGGWLTEANLKLRTSSYSSIADAKANANAVSGAGGADQLVKYELSYTQDLYFAWPEAILPARQVTHSSTMLVKNEPFPSNN